MHDIFRFLGGGRGREGEGGGGGERGRKGGKRGEERAHTRRHRKKGGEGKFAAVRITEGEVKYPILSPNRSDPTAKTY